MSRAVRESAERDAPPGARAWIRSILGAESISLAPLAGGAGRRRYWRAACDDGRTAVLMHARPEEPAVLPPALRRPRAEIPFVEVTRLLAAHDVPVPEVYAVDPERLWVLVEDLGDVRLCDLPPPERARRSEEAVDVLARVHGLTPRGVVLERSFDAEWIEFELRLFLEQVADRCLRADLTAAFEPLVAAIAALERRVSVRDFQSQNVMVDPRGRLRILDYQDALLAPPELDLTAFLFDSYVEVEGRERERLLERYARGAGRVPAAADLSLLIVQRKCKDFSRFRYLAHVKGDDRFEPYEGAARAAVAEGLAGLPAGFEPLGDLLPRALAEVGG